MKIETAQYFEVWLLLYKKPELFEFEFGRAIVVM